MHDGTVVKFFGTLGVVDPPEVKTKDGVARATFTAGNVLGLGHVVATSGAAESGPEIPNIVDIEITEPSEEARPAERWAAAAEAVKGLADYDFDAWNEQRTFDAERSRDHLR